MRTHAPVRAAASAIAALGLATALAACGDGSGARAGQAGQIPAQTTTTPPASLDPADFTTGIDHPHLPMEPGTRFTYRSDADPGGEMGRVRAVVEVTDETTEIGGVPALIVKETVSVDGVVIEESDNWFSQDSDGNVWNLGADTNTVEDTEVFETPGAWQSGKHGAHPIIIMPAGPEVGDVYITPDAPEEQEATVEILALDTAVDVPFGSFDSTVATANTNPVQPHDTYRLTYAEGVGLVLREQTEGGAQRMELISVDRP
ncbi:hypothetical protein [Streptomyces aidingensis]|uniref:Lipoprotein n=1 Tax=Streptomyces aidingensis TaxID=910347 RepID=A0A1I1N1F0_9ACTN|nr:hypothetical protein [Streptomyces aidingensis]SFC89308.1 hypothetical protein SAMN05421773_10785 [Streptomyces aidingensis]